jgi:hypothetical protein
MVAYTSPDCLPYFEGTDSPCLNTGTLCEPSTVWCDFAAIVEGRLDEFDAVVESTITSTPIAWVETTTPVVFTVGSSDVEVPFTTIRIDTDEMVDLDANNNGFTINTDGLYTVFSYAFGTTNTSGSSISSNLDIDFIPNMSVYPFSFNSLFVNRDTQVQDTTQAVNIHFTVPLFAGQFVTCTISGGGVVNDTITYSKVSLGVAWMGGLP